MDLPPKPAPPKGTPFLPAPTQATPAQRADVVSARGLSASDTDCVFHAQVQQMCNHDRVFTSLTIPKIFIGGEAHAPSPFIEPNNGKRMTLTNPWHITGLAKEFVASFKDGEVGCECVD